VTPKKLVKLSIGEVSGVDSPANEIPGFMVMKSTDAASDETATSLLGKIRDLIKGSGKEDIEMTKEELTTELDARFEAFGEALVEKLSKSVEAPEAEGATAVEKATEVEKTEVEKAEVVEPGLTIEDVTKAISEALEPYGEVFEKVLERIERTEKALAIRKSLDGQEGGEVEEAKEPTVGDAIAKAFAGRR
jgi:hypothetical protein